MLHLHMMSYPTSQTQLNSLFKDWGKRAPRILNDHEEATFIPEQDVCLITPEKVGYPAPRARLPIPESFNESEPDVVAEAVKRGLKKIIIVYPTRIKYLEALRKFFSLDTDEIHWGNLRRIHQRLPHKADFIFEEAYKQNITVDFLPMVKLTEGSAMDRCISSVRFWTAKKPENAAAYILFDDVIEKGTTIASMLSHLTSYGVPEENILGAVIGDCAIEKHFKLAQVDRKYIAWLRAEHPDTAARVDIILNLIGIHGMEALTTDEAMSLELFTKSAYVIDEKLKVIYRPHLYPPIPEPTRSYVAKLSAIGFKPQSSDRGF